MTEIKYVVAIICLGCYLPSLFAQKVIAKKRDIILFLVNDLGYTDVGVFAK